MIDVFRLRERAACPKCGALVDAKRLDERRAVAREIAVVFGLSPDDEPLDSAVIEIGWWGFKGHTVACGVCGTTR